MDEWGKLVIVWVEGVCGWIDGEEACLGRHVGRWMGGWIGDAAGWQLLPTDTSSRAVLTR